MIYPECGGNGFIRIPGKTDLWETSQSPFANEKEITCPTCEGQGEISDTPAANHCPACGEPISEDQEWCAEHQGAVLVGDHLEKAIKYGQSIK